MVDDISIWDYYNYNRVEELEIENKMLKEDNDRLRQVISDLRKCVSQNAAECR